VSENNPLALSITTAQIFDFVVRLASAAVANRQ
jgi:hypothetical protein